MSGTSIIAKFSMSLSKCNLHVSWKKNTSHALYHILIKWTTKLPFLCDQSHQFCYCLFYSNFVQCSPLYVSVGGGVGGI